MNDAVTTHPTALHRLLAELEAVTPEQVASSGPTTLRARSEEEIGILPEPLRALHALKKLKIDQFNELVKLHDAMHENEIEAAPIDQDEHQRSIEALKPLSEDVEVLDTLLWRSVREQFSVDPKASGVGIRGGWQVVDMYDPRNKSLFGLLDALFGR